MTTTDPYAGFGTKQTHQSQKAPDRPEQVMNNAGGAVFEIDPISQLRRFLTIGTANGTYYVSQKDSTEENGRSLLFLTADDANHKMLVDEIVEISLAGRAPKQNPALFALAMACQHGSTESKQYARKQITKVVRTGTHLFIFVKYLNQFGGWSRGLRKAVGSWYTEKDADQLAYQLVKYRQREGFTHRDVLRLTHPSVTTHEVDGRIEAYESLLPNAESSEHRRRLSEGIESAQSERNEILFKRGVINWAVKGEVDDQAIGSNLIMGYRAAQDPGNQADIPEILENSKLPWEALPDTAMNDVKVWDKLLDNGMPIGALLRQLPRLTNLGIVPQMGGRTDEIARMLLNEEALQKARIHPINVLVSLKTYRGGHSLRGSSSWQPTAKLVDALDEMYYRSFGYVEPAGKRRMDALDVSGSMGWSTCGDFPLTPREVTAAMAMTSVRTEPSQMTVGFTSGRDGLSHLPLSKRQRLDDVIRTISDLPFGGTDCSLPMIHALHNSLEIDTFVVYTDNETWAGAIHPYQALAQYRKSSGINARLVVVACTPTKFTIADPLDPGMLDISGFDSAVPGLITEFSAGRI